ncbi:hypothetical protein Tco_0132991 [Tanacetum coccineum]
MIRSLFPCPTLLSIVRCVEPRAPPKFLGPPVFVHGCTLYVTKFEKEFVVNIFVDNGVYSQNLQDTPESSNDNTNVVNAPREPSVVDQDPGVNISQDPPQIDHNCCYECGDSLNGIFCQKCICGSCGKGAHYGYNCPPKVPIISNPEQCNQTINEPPQILPIVHPIRNYEAENSFAYVPNPNSFYNSLKFSYPPPQPQFETYLCPHFDYQCQPINETYYEPNPSYDYSGFNQPQPPQDSVDCQEALDKILEELEELERDQRMLKELKKRIAEEQTAKKNMSIEEIRHEEQLVDREIKEIINDLGYKRFRGEEIDEEYERDCEIRIRKLKQDFNEWGSKVRKKEQAYEEEKYSAACRYMLSVTCDDEDDYIPLGDIIARNSTSKAITPDLSIGEPDNSLNMGDEHLDTIPATESDEVIKSSVENLVPIPSEFEGMSDDTSDVPTCDNNCVNVESDFVESLINRDTSIVYSSKIDPILEEFAGELAHIAPIPPGIVEADFDPNDDTSSDNDDFEDIEYVSLEEENDVDQEEKEFNLEDIFQIQDVILREKLLNVHRLISNIKSLKVNSTPDRVFESLSPFPIPVVDSDSFLEESDTSLSYLDNSLPGFEILAMYGGARSGPSPLLCNYLFPESPEVEITNDKEVEITNDEEVEITNVVIPVNVNEEEEEITDEVYELKRREKGKIVEETRSTPFPTPIRSPRIHTDLVSSDTEKLQELTVTDTKTTPSSSSLSTNLSTTNRLLSLFKAKPARFKRYKNFFQELQGRYGYLFAHLKARFLSRKSFDTLADHLQEVMVESLPTKVDMHIKEQVKKQVPEQRGNMHAEISLQIQKAIDNHIPSQVDASVRSYMSGHILHVHPAQSQTTSVPERQYQLYLSMKDDPQTSAVRPRDQENPHDDAHPEGENSEKRQKTSEYEAYVSGESLMKFENLQVLQTTCRPSAVRPDGPSTSGNQEQEDDYDFWTESYASDDDEIPTKQMSQDIMEEVSLTIDEAKLKKMADEMLRQRCTSGDEHQYHIDQMKNFLKSDIVWESRKEILVSPHPRKTTPLVQSCQRDPEAPALSLINQDLLYLKKGSSGPEKIVLSLHKFPAIIFNDDDIEERTSRWVNKCVKKFNPYARYGVEHWKNPHAKIFYIRKQKEPGKPKEIVARRANECIVSITEPDYKNLNKNDIEDMYLLIMNGKVPDYAETGLLWSLSVFIRSSVIWERVHDFQLGIESYQQKVNLTAPTISFLGVEKHKMFSIIYEPVHGIIYKNSKKEKRVMRHSEIHKFCDATLNRVLEGLKSYNNDVKYGYVQRELTNDEVEYLKLFEEEIEVRLKYRNQMRRWEMYVNGRPLGPRRERPE